MPSNRLRGFVRTWRSQPHWRMRIFLCRIFLPCSADWRSDKKQATRKWRLPGIYWSASVAETQFHSPAKFIRREPRKGQVTQAFTLQASRRLARAPTNFIGAPGAIEPIRSRMRASIRSLKAGESTSKKLATPRDVWCSHHSPFVRFTLARCNGAVAGWIACTMEIRSPKANASCATGRETKNSFESSSCSFRPMPCSSGRDTHTTVPEVDRKRIDGQASYGASSAIGDCTRTLPQQLPDAFRAGSAAIQLSLVYAVKRAEELVSFAKRCSAASRQALVLTGNTLSIKRRFKTARSGQWWLFATCELSHILTSL